MSTRALQSIARWTVVAVSAAMLLMGGRCKKPKHPLDTATDAAELAIEVDANVNASAPAVGEERTLSVPAYDWADEELVVTLRGEDGAVTAEVWVDQERFVIDVSEAAERYAD